MFYIFYMDTRTQILTAAERLFYRNGLAGSGIDEIAREADVSTRTLYKHVGSREALILAVLAERQKRFFGRLRTDGLEAFFADLESWTKTEGAHGCLFLRLDTETSVTIPGVSQVTADYRAQLRQHVSDLVQHETGSSGSTEIVQQILVLVEGATAAAIYCGGEAIRSARSAATVLISHAKAARAT